MEYDVLTDYIRGWRATLIGRSRIFKLQALLQAPPRHLMYIHGAATVSQIFKPLI